MKILKDSLWANGSALLTQIIALVTTLIVARFVGPHEYGLVATGLVILLFFQRFLLESFGFAVVRETEKHEGFVESANFCSILSGYISSILMLVIAFILYFYSYRELALVLGILSVIPILDGYGTIRTCILRKEGKFKQLASRVLIANSLAGLFAVIIAVNDFGVWALIIQQITLALCNLIIAYKYANWSSEEKINKTSLRKILNFSKPMMGNSILFVAANRLDIILLNFFSNSFNVGVYSIARRITRTIPDILLNGSNSVLMTYLRGKNIVDAIEMAGDKIKYILLLVIPFLVYIFIFSYDLVDFVFGEKWNESNMDDIIKILCVLGLFQIVISLLSTLLVSLDKPIKLTLNNFIQLTSFIFIVMLFYFFNKVDAITVSYSILLSYVISMFNLLFIIYKNRVFEFFKKVFLIIPMTMVCYFLFNINYVENNFLNMCLSFSIGLSIYLTFLIIIDTKIRSLVLLIKNKMYVR